MGSQKQSWLSRLFGWGGGRGEPSRQQPNVPAAAPALWADGQVILDDYVIEGRLGQGGMGTVYLVRSRSGGQRFAVKRTHLSDEASRRNFLAELRTWIDLP